jgi:hypothetical protein
MKRIYFLIAALLTIPFLSAQNVSVTYTFDSVKTTSGLIDPTPVTSPAGVVFGSFKAAGVALHPNASARFSFTGWPDGAKNGATSYASLAGALDTGMYFEVSLTPVYSHLISLDSIVFTVQRSGTGIRTFCIRSNFDQFTSNLPAIVDPADTNLAVETGNIFFLTQDITTLLPGSKIILAGPGFTHYPYPIIFRFYAFNSERVTGTFSLNKVDMYGTIDIIPAGIAEEGIAGLKIYPNPSVDGVFWIGPSATTPISMKGVGGTSAALKVTVYDEHGARVYSSENRECDGMEINLQNQPNGMYLVYLTSCEGVQYKEKVVVGR